MRREWRRTSSSQAEPSPWRHCWTSWASCSNVSSASNPGTVTCATTLGQFLVNRGQPISACHTMERKVPPKCSLRHPTPWPESNRRILLSLGRKHNQRPRGRVKHAATVILRASHPTRMPEEPQPQHRLKVDRLGAIRCPDSYNFTYVLSGLSRFDLTT